MIARINTAWLRLVARIIPPCHEVTRLLSQGMDHPLPWHVRVRLRLHFAGCVWCRRYAEQLRRIRFFSRRFPEKESEHGTAILPASSRARFKAAMSEEIGRRQTSGRGDAAE